MNDSMKMDFDVSLSALQRAYEQLVTYPDFHDVCDDIQILKRKCKKMMDEF